MRSARSVLSCSASERPATETGHKGYPPAMLYSNLDARLKTRTLSASFLRRLKRIREASSKTVRERTKPARDRQQNA